VSRNQETDVLSTASKQNKVYNANANTSFNTAQNDITGYGDELNAFKANNPYVQGGQVQTAQNQELADTAAGFAENAGQMLQGQAVRSGQNAGGAIAATERMQHENQRALGAEEAAATERRLASGVGYNEAVLGGRQAKEGMENQLAEEQGQLAQGDLSIAAKAAEQPSFMDVLGESFAQQLGKTAAGGQANINIPG